MEGFQFEQSLFVGKCQTSFSQIVIGGWRNTKSVIRLNREIPNKAEALTPYILSDAVYHGFWIRWKGGLVEVGNEGEQKPFLNWKNPQLFNVRYYGIRTGWGATGSWLTGERVYYCKLKKVLVKLRTLLLCRSVLFQLEIRSLLGSYAACCFCTYRYNEEKYMDIFKTEKGGDMP